MQCLVVRPDVLKPSQQAYATELPKVTPSLKTILPCAGAPGLPQDTAERRGNTKIGVINHADNIGVSITV